jgi:NADH-quinone oxidoreductase subunit G
MRDAGTASAILLIGGDPTNEHPLLAWQIRSNIRLNKARLYIANHRSIKLERQAKAVQGLPPAGYRDLTAILDRNETEFAKAVMAEESLLVIFGEEFQGDQIGSFVSWGLHRGNIRFALLGDYVNSRGAADMGLLPDVLPGYIPVANPGEFTAQYPNLSAVPGLALPQMFEAASNGKLAALLVVGANPVKARNLPADTLKDTFVIALDLFLTETAALADVVLPAASLYEKTGTVTNTFGDVQLVQKAADKAGTRPDFEILVRLAAAMDANVQSLVPFSKAGVRADLGQSRGAQSGEADRHGVWLAAHGLEPKLSPFDPLAVLDEIERLVPAYKLDRLTLFSGNDMRTEPGFVPVSALTQPHPEWIVPAHDTLFTSGTLGRYSRALQDLNVHESQQPELAETAAD